MTYKAVLVEDSVPNGNQYADSLRSNHFEVEWFTNASAARAYLAENPDILLDLFVLDREIPDLPNDTESVETGDNLFDQIQATWSDTPIFVFTGRSTPGHTQNAISNRGQLALGANVSIDRVQIMYKEQGSRFLERVRQIVDELDRLQDVHVIPATDEDASDRVRALRRLFAKLAARNNCLAIRVRPLGGGRSGDEVFACELLEDEGIVAAAFVGKTRAPGWIPSHGGMFGFPQDIVAPHVDVVSGMAGGTVLELFQIVSGATPLEVLLMSNDADGPAAIDALAASTMSHGGTTATRRVGFEELVEPLVSMDFLAPQLDAMGLTSPRPSLAILSTRSVQHGDLHSGNVLVKDRHPALIDFGRRATASQLLDPVTLMLSMWLHPDGKWFRESSAAVEPVDAIRAIIEGNEDHLADDGIKAVVKWIVALQPDSRELWLVSLGYAIRQLWYPGTVANEIARSRVEAISRAACAAIAAN